MNTSKSFKDLNTSELTEINAGGIWTVLAKAALDGVVSVITDPGIPVH